MRKDNKDHNTISPRMQEKLLVKKKIVIFAKKLGQNTAS